MQDIFALSKLAQLHNGRWLKSYDINSSEHSVLVYLAMHQSSNQERIAQYMLLDKGTIARILTKLEDKSLLTRRANPANRRENLISLTEQGLTLVNTLASASEQLGSDLLSDIAPQEQAVFEAVLRQLRINAVQLIHPPEKESQIPK